MPMDCNCRQNKCFAVMYHRLFLDRLRLRWLKRMAIILNTMITCLGLLCIVMGLVLSSLLDKTIPSPKDYFVVIPVGIFALGSMAMLISFCGYSCLNKVTTGRLITYLVVLGLIFLSILGACGCLLQIANENSKLNEWISTELANMYDKSSKSLYGMQSVFLIENQLSCCGLNGPAYYPDNNLSWGCCQDATQKCTMDRAYTKSCVTAFLEQICERFKSFGIVLLCFDVVVAVSIFNGFLLLANHRWMVKEKSAGANN